MTERDVHTAQDLHLADRLLYLLHRIRTNTADAVASTLADLGLNGTQSLILESLEELGEAPAAELARRCLVSRQALSGPLDKLERDGLVTRPASHHSAHVRPVALSERGRMVAVFARERVDRLEAGSRALFTPEELERFTQMLTTYADYWADVRSVDRTN